MTRPHSSAIARTGFDVVSDSESGSPLTTTVRSATRPASGEARRVNVLFLAKQFPWPLNVGSRQRVFHLIKGIAAAHDVITIAYDAVPSTQDLNEFTAASGCIRTTVVPRAVAGPITQPATTIARLQSRAARAAGAIKALVGSPLPAFARDSGRIRSSRRSGKRRAITRLTSYTRRNPGWPNTPARRDSTRSWWTWTI